jgi:alpha-D-xyloside xylohydrolase
MRLDSSDYLPIEASSSLGASASGASFATSTGDMLEIGSFGPGIFRLRVGPNTRPDYGLIAARAQRCDVAQPSRGLWTFSASDGSLELAGTPLTLRLLHAGKPVLASITDRTRGGRTRLPAIGRARHGQSWLAAFALASGEPVYGLGAQTATLNKRGQLVHSQVEPVGAPPAASGTSAPFCWSPGPGGGAWGVCVHTPSRVLHGIGYPDWSQRSYGLVVDDEALDLFLIAGRDPAQLIERYAALTGRAPEVPRWSLGVWIARPVDASADDAVAAASSLRERRLPCDVLALDGAAPWDRWTSFDFRWDPRRYPDPAAALGRIRQHGFKVCVCEQPAISIHSPLFHDLAARKYLLTAAGGRPYERAAPTGPDDAPPGAQLAPPSGIIDLTNPAAYAWWRNAHEALFKAGVDVIETDGGDNVPADAVAFNGDTGHRLANAYPLLYERCVYDASEKFAPPDQAPALIWSRAGWSGSQRYPVQSNGETQGDWEGLAASIRACLSNGMSGVPYHACEVGGYGAEPVAAELYLRWLQAGVFASHLKLRAGAGGDPWPLDAEHEKIALQWLEFRYRLLPYLGTVVAQASKTGMPVLRAMPLAFPGNALTRGHDMQFMCGEALLVAPVLAPGGEVDVALPPGAWYDLASRQRIAGRQVIRYRATLDRFPVFGREGYALPLGPALQHTGEADGDHPLNALWVFGKPAHALDGFAQASIALIAEGPAISAASGVQVEVFGDATGIRIDTRT